MFKVPEKIKSKYMFILIAAERAKRILAGSPPKIETKHTKPTYIAIEELLQDKVEFVLEKDEKDKDEDVSLGKK